MNTTIVFRCCKNCGSAEDVRAEQATCPGCGTSYLEQAEARIQELEKQVWQLFNKAYDREERIAKVKAILARILSPDYRPPVEIRVREVIEILEGK